MATLLEPHRPISHQNIDRLPWIPFQDEAEKVQHESAMEALSQQYPADEHLVRRLYLEKLREYMPEATIRTFVSIFVVRDIKETLSSRESTIH